MKLDSPKYSAYSSENSPELAQNASSTTTTTAKSLQSCPTLCDPIDGSPTGSPTPGILQARTLEWVAISFSNAWKWKVKVKSLSRIRLLATPWTAAHQAPPSMGFSRQEYWSGVPLPSASSTGTVEIHNLIHLPKRQSWNTDLDFSQLPLEVALACSLIWVRCHCPVI